MADEKVYLTAWGVYRLGYLLERLEWAIATIKEPIELAPFIESFRFYEQVHPFEDIGQAAKDLNNMLSSYEEPEVSAETKDYLRDTRSHWYALIQERLQDLYLVTPMCKVGPRKLMRGIEMFLKKDLFSLLEKIEVSDLNEACRCILVGSTTAGEHIALRAAENLLRRWYEYKTGEKLRYETWGTVLNNLVKEYPENKRPKEISLLGYLKQRRDEVAHPQRVSSLLEAETTLMNVCILIEGIEPVLAKHAPSPVG